MPRSRGLRQACKAVREQLEELAPHTTERIRTAVPAYLNVPLDEHLAGVRQQHQNLLTMLEEGRGATSDELFAARRIGRDRARQGLSLEDVVEAFHIGCEETWNRLSAAAPGDLELLQSVGRLWRWIHEAANAVAEGHQDVTAQDRAADVAARNDLFTALHERHTDAARALAPRLGYDVGEAFQAVVVVGQVLDEARLRGVQTMLDRQKSGIAHCVRRGRHLEVLLQGAPASSLLPALRRYAVEGSTGVGLRRPGIEGASASLEDAVQAAALAQPAGPWIEFEHAWLPATVAEAADRLRAVVEQELRMSVEHPQIANTVSALIDNDMSVSRAASALFLHPNTARYRLGRWHELTGFDPGTAPGVLRFVTAQAIRQSDESRGKGGINPA